MQISKKPGAPISDLSRQALPKNTNAHSGSSLWALFLSSLSLTAPPTAEIADRLLVAWQSKNTQSSAKGQQVFSKEGNHFSVKALNYGFRGFTMYAAPPERGVDCSNRTTKAFSSAINYREQLFSITGKIQNNPL